MASKKFNDTFLKACRGEPTAYTPVWYMRQAGRYQPEYQKIREKYSFFEMSEIPEVCAEVTRLPVEQLGVDAAILFADIMTPLRPIGIDVDIVAHTGPVIANPIRTAGDVRRLRDLEPENDIPYVMEAVRILKEQLHVPLIGFAGAPFTLASYLIEGGPSKNYYRTKAFMYREPEAWNELMDKLQRLTVTYLSAQIRAGADAVQLFDSWIGVLGVEDFRTYIAPVMDRIFRQLRETGVPIIYFGLGTGHLLKEWNRLPIDVIGLDWRTSIGEARRMGIDKALQGNLDPVLLLAPWDMLRERAAAILDEGNRKPGYIFNVGHGLFPSVDVATVQRLTAFVHEYTNKG